MQTATTRTGAGVFAKAAINPTVFPILFAISFIHLCNDSLQAVVPAISPILKESMSLSYTQIGWVLFVLNFTASILQPIFGLYADKRPSPYMLPLGMASSLLGMLGLGLAANYGWVLVSVALVGIGSAVFHPEASRVAFLAAGPRRGLAQSIFQVGGNTGQALQSMITLAIFIPLGQHGVLWFIAVAAVALVMQFGIAKWYGNALEVSSQKKRSAAAAAGAERPRKALLFAIGMLIFLVFARSWYHAGIVGYYQYFAIEKFGITLKESQVYIFLFMIAGVAGTFFGGPLADKFGRRNMIWFSMLGSAPFALLLPYANPFWSHVIFIIMGFIILSSFSVVVVYAQELFPGKIGLVSGLIVGLAFGMGAVGSVALGKLIDTIGLTPVMQMLSFLPLLGILTILLPSDKKIKSWSEG